MRKATTVMLALAVVLVFSTVALAQDPVHYKVTVTGEIVKGSPADHFLTFNTPIEVPAATLAAGTYIFSFVAPSVVQVSSADRSEVYATFFTAPVVAFEDREHYAVTLSRTEELAPGRITKWFLPNRSLAFEFLYSTTELRGER